MPETLADRIILHAIGCGMALQPWQFDAVAKVYEECPDARP